MFKIKNYNYFLIFEHLIPTLIISLIYIGFFDNIYYLGLIVLVGWLIDADHLYDYFIYLVKANEKFSLRTFLSGKYFTFNKKVYVILHSYEISVIILVLAYTLNIKEVYFIFTSYIIHLIQDQITNKPKNYGYFIVYRMYNGFRLESFCK